MERGLTLKELAEQTGLSSSALGSYEADDTKDISHYALIRLAKFYGVTAEAPEEGVDSALLGVGEAVVELPEELIAVLVSPAEDLCSPRCTRPG